MQLDQPIFLKLFFQDGVHFRFNHEILKVI